MADRPAPTDTNIPVAPNESRVLAHPRPSLPIEQATAPAPEPIVQDLPLDGQWLPGPDPLVIGPKNFSVMQNLRYRDRELQSVLGYTRLTTNPHGTYTKGRNGVQFYKTINGSPLSILLVHAENAALSQSAILVHTPAVPQAGDFNANVLHTDTAGAGLGRFSQAPDQNVVYCNGREAMIWAGEEHRIPAFIVTQASGALRRDYTSAVRNVLTDSQNIAVVHIDGSTAPYILIGTTRPLTAFKLYSLTPNTEAVTMAVNHWTASGWAAVANLVDGTAVAGETLAQTGVVSFDSTATTAKVKVEGELVLYFYQVVISGATSAGTAVYYATAAPAFQRIRDIWDGAYREPVQFHLFKGGKFQDYTPDVLEEESSTNAFAALLGGLTSSEYVLVGFTERAMAVKWRFVADQINTNAATVTVGYWNGSGYTSVANLSDGTLDPGGTVTLTRNGTMAWTPPDQNSEFPQTLFGVTAFWYKITPSASLSADVDVDMVQGIPAPRVLEGFVFPFQFQSRLFLMGDTVGNQGNRAEYSLPNAPDVWNGEDTSGSGKSLFFGEGGTLTGAVEIYNRFAGALAYLAVVCKNHETFILSGNDPESFAVFPMSKTIGCPAPLTMCSTEVAYSVSEDAQRNIALWLSHEGPVYCDASIIAIIPGLEPYFDQDDARHINTAAIEHARGWYDHGHREYNLLFPSGTGQTTCNVWVVYDLKRQRWYEKVPPTYPQGVFPAQDLQGLAYGYGLIDTGHLLRLDHGFTYDGTGITQVLESADIMPANSSFEETRMRHLRVILKRGSGTSADMAVTHFADGATSGTALANVGVTAGSNRLVYSLQGTNRQGISHRLRLSVTTTDQQLIWLAFGAWFERFRQKAR